jgi:UDP-N-acetylglucosamine 2-epimerase (non-hydrolysing)
MACAVTAAKCGPLVAHVEAGLRSRDWSMPEEVNRVVTDRVSDYLFAPSPDAAANLRAEGYRADQVHLVGNVMVDTLRANLERARSRTILNELGIDGEPYGLVTLHRPSNVDEPSTLADLAGTLAVVARDCPLVFPVHPRARASLAGLHPPAGVRLIDPIGYLDFLALEQAARVVITDSGGVQEETTVLGVPCLTVRDGTERPITITEGTNRLVGRDRETIVAAARDALNGRVPARRPRLWDGEAAPRIADVLVEGRGPDGHLRPTDVADADAQAPATSSE